MRARSTRPVASVRERAILANAQHWSGSIESVMTRRAATIASPGDARPLLTISRVHCIRPYNISTIWNLCTSGQDDQLYQRQQATLAGEAVLCLLRPRRHACTASRTE